MKYEYKVISILKFNPVKYTEKLNKYGIEGWKFVCTDNSMHYFVKGLKEVTF
ncbi:MAG: DUF4177 domain-containing protein [Clostridiales bacterium]|nr:DUF4177 domain-containing protein [Clostridiales bacterium]